MILSAGLGVRLRPYTLSCPKPLIQVQGKALIEHHLLALAKAGIVEVVINVCHLAEQIKKQLGSGDQYGVRIHYSDETQTGLLGAYGGVHRALPLLQDEPFLLISSDIFTSFDFGSLLQQTDHAAHVVMAPNPQWHPDGDLYVFEKQLHATEGVRHTYANIGVFHAKLFNKKQPSQFSFRHFLDQLIQNEKISAEIFSGDWHNVGTVAQWQQVASADDCLPEQGS